MGCPSALGNTARQVGTLRFPGRGSLHAQIQAHVLHTPLSPSTYNFSNVQLDDGTRLEPALRYINREVRGEETKNTEKIETTKNTESTEKTEAEANSDKAR